MFNLKGTTHRRGFLGSVAAGAALGITSLTSPFRLMAGSNNLHPEPNGGEFEDWLNKINGKHRQVFDAPSANSGFPLAWARIFLMTNKAIGVDEKDCTSVVVLRHDAIPLAMGHTLWEKYKFGEVFKITDKVTNAPAVRNPYWQPKPGELVLPDMSVDELLNSGVLLGVCDVAITLYSSHVAQSMKMDAAEVKKDWISGVFPGIQILPSGVLAVNRAQEHGCTYCYAGEG